MNEILVCITFREFDGGINDKIQRRVLESLKEQTYQNFKLIVTNFKEKNVKKVLDEYSLPYEFHQSDLKDYNYSWTELIESSFTHLEKGKHIVYWTQADCIIEPNFFAEIINNFKPGCGGTSWPVLYYDSLEDFEIRKIVPNTAGYENCLEGNPYNTLVYRILSEFIPKSSFLQYDAGLWVLDSIFIDGDLLLDNENQKIFTDYKICGALQGITQSLMLAFVSNKLINLIFKSKVHEIRNFRSGGEQWWGEIPELTNEAVVNRGILDRFLEDRKIPMKFRPSSPLAKINIHKRYKIKGNLYQRMIFKLYIGKWVMFHMWIHVFFYGAGTNFLRKPWPKKIDTVRKYLKYNR